MPRRPKDRVGIGFMIAWLVFWSAAILVAVWHMGAAAWRGEPGALVFLAAWVAAAGYGLRSGARRLLTMMTGAKAPPRPARNHHWDDGLDRPEG